MISGTVVSARVALATGGMPHEKEQLKMGHAVLKNLEAAQQHARGREQKSLSERIAVSMLKLRESYDNIIMATQSPVYRRVHSASAAEVSLLSADEITTPGGIGSRAIWRVSSFQRRVTRQS